MGIVFGILLIAWGMLEMVNGVAWFIDMPGFPLLLVKFRPEDDGWVFYVVAGLKILVGVFLII